jgi:transposase
MKAYSLDLRQRVLQAALSGNHTISEVASLFNVGTTFVNKVLGLHRTGQDLAPRPHGGGYPERLSKAHHKLLRSEVRKRNDATLEELRSHLQDEAGVRVSRATVGRVLSRLGLSRKKKSGGQRAQQP